MCDDKYIGNAQNTLKNRMDVYFSNILRLLKN